MPSFFFPFLLSFLPSFPPPVPPSSFLFFPLPFQPCHTQGPFLQVLDLVEAMICKCIRECKGDSLQLGRENDRTGKQGMPATARPRETRRRVRRKRLCSVLEAREQKAYGGGECAVALCVCARARLPEHKHLCRLGGALERVE